MNAIDLNADVGEGAGTDADLFALISSANIACGGHAGDAESIRAALALCCKHGVAAGAHPGFADRENFGRDRLDLSPDEIGAQVADQIDLFLALAADADVPVRHVKLHGALANMAAENLVIASAAFLPVAALPTPPAILALAESAQVDAAHTLGLSVISEAYADRAYTSEGLLVSRDQPGAVLTDSEAVIAQCRLLAVQGQLATIDGTLIESSARSICVHGDTPGAVDLARLVRDALRADGVEIRATG